MSHFTVAVFSKRPEDVETLLDPFNENTCDPEYLEWEADEDGDFNEEYRECGYFRNPNAKWDWYQIGGRWDMWLCLKNGKGKCNQAQVKDIDFTPDSQVYRHAIRFWEINIEGQPLQEGESASDFSCFYNAKYYLDRYGTKEAYAQADSEFTTWAFLTPDGEWNEQGEMGWFGIGTDTKESIFAYRQQLERIIKENPDLWLTVVDCHI